jgi:hypothetical protein
MPCIFWRSRYNAYRTLPSDFLTLETLNVYSLETDDLLWALSRLMLA